MSALLITGPKHEPVSVEQLRAHLHIGTHDDGLLASLVTAARMTIEAQFGLRMISQHWRMLVPRLSYRQIDLSVWPVEEISQITIKSDREVRLQTNQFSLDKQRRPSRLTLDSAILNIRVDGSYSAQIDLLAGFGTDPDVVPENLRLAVKMLAAHWYDVDDWNHYRADSAIPPHVRTMLAEHRIARL